MIGSITMSMNMTELTRLMSELRRMGLSDTQIVDLVLHIESGAKAQDDEEKSSN